MASLYSFDIVSSFDRQEMKNAVDQAQREIQQRYDLKDTKSKLELTESAITIETDSEYALQAITDLLESKMVRRNLSLKILDYGQVEQASSGRVRQEAKLREGIPEDIAKQITKRIREDFKKVNGQIQGNAVRVQAKNKDDLQLVIATFKEEDLPIALQFVNYR